MKKKFMMIFSVMLFTFTVTNAQMETGSFAADYNSPGYALHQGNGVRSFDIDVRFNKPFDSRPNVSVSVISVDSDKEVNTRYIAEALGINKGGFLLRISTWDNSMIYGITGQWFAQLQEIEAESIPVKVGNTIRLNNVLFETGKAALQSESYKELDKVVEFLGSNPSVKIELSGHTDNVGSDATNLKLSQDRADAVKAYLVGKGIADGRIDAKGYGSTRPVASNKFESGRDLNRRVEFTILEK
ncbi:MAG: OmpA family protein [Melioribacteraceae bacterium]|nr:OmpA family protein [Melioribacteraceae bacterium]MCF8355253.1 OmpA family protein [Melioribacteraceae bacterium]MCF8394152.1 OmpA family protein [Melioribacteraceae bacterium]MCF8418835.1 OmpA family protein [Melioribacteraceae bacterium]